MSDAVWAGLSDRHGPGWQDIVLAPMLRHGVLVFVDDILVHTKEMEAHKRLLRQVFELLHQHRLKAKMSKCTFA